MATDKNTKMGAAQAALRKDHAAKIEKLQAAYDAEMVKYLDLNRRIDEETSLGASVEEIGLLERALDVVQQDRRTIGDQLSEALHEWRSIDAPSPEEE